MEILVFPWRWLEAAVAFRAVGINDGADNLTDERLGGHIRVHHKAFKGSGRVVYSPMLNVISEGELALGVSITERIAIFTEFDRFAPAFEGDSIFNVFDLEPQNDLGGRLTVKVSEAIDLALWGFSRFANHAQGILGEEEDSMVAGAGGGLGGNYRTRDWDISSRITYVAEWGEKRIGTELGAGRGFFYDRRLWLFARASYFRIDDDFSELFNGNVLGYILSARFNIAKGFRTLAEFEHYLGDNRPSRFVALGLVELDLWR